MAERQEMTRKNRPKVEMDRSELATKVVASKMYCIFYKPSLWQQIQRWLHLSNPCEAHGRDKWCTDCPPYEED